MLGAAATLAACSEGTGPADLSDLDADLATVTAEVAAQDIELMRGPGGPLGFGMPALRGRFECGTFEHRELTITRTCTFLDADGNEQDAYDSLTTASVVLHFEVTGSVEHGEFSATMTRVRDLTVTGLEGVETAMTWNGTGSDDITRVHPTRDGGETQFDLSAEETITDLVIPVPRSDTGWPLSGTVTKRVVITITGGPRDGTSRERDVTIAFDGTQFATVTVNGETFTVDLAQRRHREPPDGMGRGRGGMRP
jgi:hypothetical protein